MCLKTYFWLCSCQELLIFSSCNLQGYHSRSGHLWLIGYLLVRTIIGHKIQMWLCFYPWQTHEYMSNNGQTAMMRKHIKWCTNKVQASVVPRLSSVMEANEKKAILNCFKWLAFILCLFAFLWKTTDSFITYFDKDIGTKITLHRNYEADLPEFAICRHPNRYLK